MCMLKITARSLLRFWQIVETKSKTMGSPTIYMYMYLSENKWLSLIALTGKAVFVWTENSYIRLFRLRFWQIVEASARRRARRGVTGLDEGLYYLCTSRMVSFSFSIIDYKSLTYIGGSRPITIFRPNKNSFSSQSDETAT